MTQPIPNIANDEPRAPYMQVAKEGQLTIRQLIEKARGLHPGPKRVLAEICNLHEKGGRECYDANNNHLAKMLGMTVPMVSRHIHSLAERGLILLSPKKNGQKRTLTPDASLQAAYRSGESGKITEVVKSILESGKITSFEDESGKKEFTEVVNKNYQFGKHNTSLIKEENTLLSSMVAELQSALDAANAAHQEKEAELASLIEGLEKRIENGILKFKAQELELAGLRTASLAIVNAKPAKAPRQKSALHSFADSPYALVATVEAALAGTDYEHADIAYYHEVIYNWATSKGERRADWLGTIRNAIIKDSKEGKLKLNPNSQLIPTEHDKQQQSARAQQLGLYDPAKRQAARELLSAYRAGQ